MYYQNKNISKLEVFLFCKEQALFRLKNFLSFQMGNRADLIA